MSSKTTATATTTTDVRVDTPFTSGALRSGSSIDFWKAYVEARPSPPEEFFRLLWEYHQTHGDPHNGIAHDVGTGPGNIAARLTAYFDRVTGSDLNENALAAAPLLAPPGLMDRMSFIQSPAEDLAVRTPQALGGGGTTDLITVSECVPLLDTPKALKAFQHLLRPGGTLGIYFYGPAVFTDGDVDRCNAAYDKIATRICTFNQPMKGTPGFPFHVRAAEALVSYLDNIFVPTDDWESVQRYKWNCDYPLIFNSMAGFDFVVDPVDRRAATEVTNEVNDRGFWGAEWSIENVKSYLDSVYPNYRDKAGDRMSEIDALVDELHIAMEGVTRKVTFPTVLIMATKKPASPSQDAHLDSSTKANQIGLSLQRPGLGRVIDSPPGSIEATNKLLQKNHDEFHIFWRDVNGHNHMAHSLLTHFALGASPSELQRANDDGVAVQRRMPALDVKAVADFSDDAKLYESMGQNSQYANVLVFFEQQIDKLGWKVVLQKYCFARTKLADAILSRMFEGAYHPIIHLGLGVEFEQPGIIAEGLAQAVTHSLSGIPDCLLQTDRDSPGLRSDERCKDLVQLFQEARSDDIIFRGPRCEDGPNRMKDGVLGRCKVAITRLATRFWVDPSEVERAVAHVIACSAYIAGASQRSNKSPKIDFFYMHAVTSSIFLTVLVQEPWISIKDKVRLVEWKGRTDLLWYAASGCPQLDVEVINGYEAGPSVNMGWAELYRAVNVMHDDGHVAKFIRAIKSAETELEKHDSLDAPLRASAMLPLARMTYDSTIGLPDLAKWVWGVGFEQAWAQVPSRAGRVVS